MSPRRPPGSLESQILAILHGAGRALSPGEVREELSKDGTELSYSAIVTTLSRLHAKNLVTRRRDGHAFRYAAPTDPSGLVAWRMRRLLNTEDDHEPVLMHFIEGLPPEDEDLIRRLLSEESDDA